MAAFTITYCVCLGKLARIWDTGKFGHKSNSYFEIVFFFYLYLDQGYIFILDAITKVEGIWIYLHPPTHI